MRDDIDHVDDIDDVDFVDNRFDRPSPAPDVAHCEPGTGRRQGPATGVAAESCQNTGLLPTVSVLHHFRLVTRQRVAFEFGLEE